MTRTINFTHNDLDGIGCGILHKAGFGLLSETHYCGYHNVDEKITSFIRNIDVYETERPTIIITDLGIKPETAELVDRYEGKKIMLDHHATNAWIGEKYEWATIDIEASGTLLMFNHFEKEIPRKFLDFALHVDDYDRWVHAMPKSKELNRLFYLIGIKRFEARFLSNEEVVFNLFETMLLEMEDDSVARYTDRVEKGIKIYELAGDKRFGVGFAERYQSETAHNLLDRLDLDAIALIDVNFRKVSLRSKANFDIGSIAKRLGGGGHKNAAGVEFEYGHIDDFNTKKFPLMGVYSGLEDMVFAIYRKVKSTFEEIETEAMAELFEKRGVQ